MVPLFCILGRGTQIFVQFDWPKSIFGFMFLLLYQGKECPYLYLLYKKLNKYLNVNLHFLTRVVEA